MGRIADKPSERAAGSRKGLLAHAALLAAGAVFLALPAFSPTTWFDESYSLALARQPLADLIGIAAADVHPPLYYVLLRAVYLLAGPGTVPLRLFSVAGAVALAALGLTHVRRDFGPRAGMLFTLAACLTPYLAYTAIQVRMYSWTTFAVTLCFICACRLMRSARAGARPTAATWAVFFLSSLAAAYLHYFGMLAAFVMNAAVLGALVSALRRARRTGEGKGASAASAPPAPRAQIAVFLAQAAVQVAAYLPWLAVLMGQLAEKTNGRFWVTFAFPESLLQILAYPLASEQVAYALWDVGALGAVGGALIACALVVAAAVLLHGMVRAGADVRRAARLACAVYAGVGVLGIAVSQIMGSLIVYYRYFSLALGPVLVAVAATLGEVPWSRVPAGGAGPADGRRAAQGAAAPEGSAPEAGTAAGAFAATGACAGDRAAADAALLRAPLPVLVMRGATVALAVALAACGAAHQALTVSQIYSPQNDAVFRYLEACGEDLAEAGGGNAAGEAEEPDAVAPDSAVAASPSTAAASPSALPVLSNDITVLGTAWAAGVEAPLVYADFYDGYWNRAYACYEPDVTSADTAAEALAGSGGCFAYLDIGQSDDPSVGTVKEPRAAIERMEELTGARAVGTRAFWRPYEHRVYYVTLFEGAGQ